MITRFPGKKITAILLALAFVVSGQTGFAAGIVPTPVDKLNLNLAGDNRLYPLLKGVKLNPSDPFKMEFILDTPGDQVPSREEVAQVVHYFLAALTLPEADLWVNFSPYEPDRVITDDLAKTHMGEAFLQQDYLLKQLASGLTYPETQAGKKYWNEINNVGARSPRPGRGNPAPTNALNRVWIVPQGALVKENGVSAYIARSALKVMMEGDYLAQQVNRVDRVYRVSRVGEPFGNSMGPKNSSSSTNSFKTHILPLIENDVNHSRAFAPLRQVYSAFVLAYWFKAKVRESIFKYYIDNKKLSGIDKASSQAKEKLYNQYLEAFKNGAYDYIKRESVSGWHASPVTKIEKRRYFSGGVRIGGPVNFTPVTPADIMAGPHATVDFMPIKSGSFKHPGSRRVYNETYFNRGEYLERSLGVEYQTELGVSFKLISDAGISLHDNVPAFHFVDNGGLIVVLRKDIYDDPQMRQQALEHQLWMYRYQIDPQVREYAIEQYISEYVNGNPLLMLLGDAGEALVEPEIRMLIESGDEDETWDLVHSNDPAEELGARIMERFSDIRYMIADRLASARYIADHIDDLTVSPIHRQELAKLSLRQVRVMLHEDRSSHEALWRKFFAADAEKILRYEKAFADGLKEKDRHVEAVDPAAFNYEEDVVSADEGTPLRLSDLEGLSKPLIWILSQVPPERVCHAFTAGHGPDGKKNRRVTYVMDKISGKHLPAGVVRENLLAVTDRMRRLEDVDLSRLTGEGVVRYLQEKGILIHEDTKAGRGNYKHIGPTSSDQEDSSYDHEYLQRAMISNHPHNITKGGYQEKYGKRYQLVTDEGIPLPGELPSRHFTDAQGNLIIVLRQDIYDDPAKREEAIEHECLEKQFENDERVRNYVFNKVVGDLVDFIISSARGLQITKTDLRSELMRSIKSGEKVYLAGEGGMIAGVIDPKAMVAKEAQALAHRLASDQYILNHFDPKAPALSPIHHEEIEKLSRETRAYITYEDRTDRAKVRRVFFSEEDATQIERYEDLFQSKITVSKEGAEAVEPALYNQPRDVFHKHPYLPICLSDVLGLVRQARVICDEIERGTPVIVSADGDATVLYICKYLLGQTSDIAYGKHRLDDAIAKLEEMLRDGRDMDLSRLTGEGIVRLLTRLSIFPEAEQITPRECSQRGHSNKGPRHGDAYKHITQKGAPPVLAEVLKRWSTVDPENIFSYHKDFLGKPVSFFYIYDSEEAPIPDNLPAYRPKGANFVVLNRNLKDNDQARGEALEHEAFELFVEGNLWGRVYRLAVKVEVHDFIDDFLRTLGDDDLQKNLTLRAEIADFLTEKILVSPGGNINFVGKVCPDYPDLENHIRNNTHKIIPKVNKLAKRMVHMFASAYMAVNYVRNHEGESQAGRKYPDITILHEQEIDRCNPSELAHLLNESRIWVDLYISDLSRELKDQGFLDDYVRYQARFQLCLIEALRAKGKIATVISSPFDRSGSVRTLADGGGIVPSGANDVNDTNGLRELMAKSEREPATFDWEKIGARDRAVIKRIQERGSGSCRKAIDILKDWGMNFNLHSYNNLQVLQLLTALRADGEPSRGKRDSGEFSSSPPSTPKARGGVEIGSKDIHIDKSNGVDTVISGEAMMRLQAAAGMAFTVESVQP